MTAESRGRVQKGNRQAFGGQGRNDEARHEACKTRRNINLQAFANVILGMHGAAWPVRSFLSKVFNQSTLPYLFKSWR